VYTGRVSKLVGKPDVYQLPKIIDAQNLQLFQLGHINCRC
jgi:hypothetical protein